MVIRGGGVTSLIGGTGQEVLWPRALAEAPNAIQELGRPAGVKLDPGEAG